MEVRSTRQRRPRVRVRSGSAALAVVLLTAPVHMTACGGSDSGSSAVAPDEAQTITDGTTIPASITMLDPVDAADVLGGGGIRIIDVRTPAEFAEGHIAGAELVDISQPGFVERISALDPAGAYFVYCRSDNRSGVATEMMLDLGFTSLYELRGGTIAWQQAGLPLDLG